MIDKVIIAEDHESSNLSVEKTIESLQIRQSDYVFYCDDAFSKIQLALKKEQPYDLLITDLYFENDGTVQKIKDGFELIRCVREEQPGIPILVFTGEDRPTLVNKLFHEYEVDAYVRKARHDIKELKLAFEAITNRQRYYPPGMRLLMKQASTHNFTEIDIIIIQLIAKGYRQKEIEEYLKQRNIEPCSLSMIEKRLKQIRDERGFSKNEQLVLLCKDLGII